MSGKKGCIVRNQRNKNQPLFLTFILRTFDKNFAQLQKRYRDFDDVLVRRLVKRVEVVNQDKCNVVLNSGQTIGVSMEMNM